MKTLLILLLLMFLSDEILKFAFIKPIIGRGDVWKNNNAYIAHCILTAIELAICLLMTILCLTKAISV